MDTTLSRGIWTGACQKQWSAGWGWGTAPRTVTSRRSTAPRPPWCRTRAFHSGHPCSRLEGRYFLIEHCVSSVQKTPPRHHDMSFGAVCGLYLCGFSLPQGRPVPSQTSRWLWGRAWGISPSAATTARDTPPPPASFTHARTNAPAPPSRPFRHCKEQPVAHAHSEEAVVRGERRVPPPPPRPLPKALGCFRSSPAPPPPPFPAPSPLAWAPQSRRRGGRRWKMAAGIGGEAAAAAAEAAAVMQKRPSAASARAGVDRGWAGRRLGCAATALPGAGPSSSPSLAASLAFPACPGPPPSPRPGMDVGSPPCRCARRCEAANRRCRWAGPVRRARERGGGEGRKMSDTKVKVAVRVRPMNRRGKPALGKWGRRGPGVWGGGGTGARLRRARRPPSPPGGGRMNPLTHTHHTPPPPPPAPRCLSQARLPACPRWGGAGGGRAARRRREGGVCGECSGPRYSPPPCRLAELDLNTKCIVEMEGNQTVLHPPPSNSKQGER